VTDKAPASCEWLLCHCCGRSFPAGNMVAFHRNPGDRVCVTCAAWLYDRSRPISRRLFPVWRLRARFPSRDCTS